MLLDRLLAIEREASAAMMELVALNDTAGCDRSDVPFLLFLLGEAALEGTHPDENWCDPVCLVEAGGWGDWCDVLAQIKRLEGLGILVSRPGRGNFVGGSHTVEVRLLKSRHWAAQWEVTRMECWQSLAHRYAQEFGPGLAPEARINV